MVVCGVSVSSIRGSVSSVPPGPTLLSRVRDCSAPVNARAQRRLSALYAGLVGSHSPQRGDTSFASLPFGSCRGSSLLLGAQPSGGHVFCRTTESSTPPSSVILGRAGDHPVPASARALRGLRASPSGLVVSRSPQHGSTKFISWPLGSCRGSDLSLLPLHFTFLMLGAQSLGAPLVAAPSDPSRHWWSSTGQKTTLFPLVREPSVGLAPLLPDPLSRALHRVGTQSLPSGHLGRGLTLPPLHAFYFRLLDAQSSGPRCVAVPPGPVLLSEEQGPPRFSPCASPMWAKRSSRQSHHASSSATVVASRSPSLRSAKSTFPAVSGAH
ncbi:hypothetical protein NDU88_004893 [Pleurodeles waltl]|uniref:Uncharacterized protein n=1 Tax=Pleurodeles waltl TaxID=8319 RepID=A0AAV7LLA2_PLEWA|nr:hypothetical protein NDU88_004893 [Pleurodeles waltl]